MKRMGMRITKPIHRKPVNNGTGFSPIDLSPVVWLENKVLSRPSWNEAGKQLNDSSGNGNNGELFSGVSLGFTSSNNDTVTFSALSSMTDFTVAFYAIDISSNPVIITDDTGNEFIQVLSTRVRISFPGAYDVLCSPVDGDHIVVKRTSNEGEVWINGVSQGTVDMTGSSSAWTPNALFRWGGSIYYTGEIKDLEVYSNATAYTASDIYNNPQNFLTRAQNANCELAYTLADLGEDDPTIWDYSTNANHGTFSTTAASPYNPFVTGISKGYQSALGGFNQYYRLDGVDDEIVTVTTYSGTGTWEVTYVHLGFSGTQRLFGTGSSQGRRCSTNTSGGGQWQIRTSGTTTDELSIGVGSFASGVSIGDIIKITQSVTSDTHSITIENETTGESVNTSNAITSTDIPSTSKDFHIGDDGQGATFGQLMPIRATIQGDDYTFTVTGVSALTVNGSPYKQNIFGTAYNSTNDIFGNATGYQDNIDLTLKGGDHSGINLGSGVDTSGAFSFLFKVKIQDVDGTVFLFDNRSGNGDGVDCFFNQGNNRRLSLRIDNGGEINMSTSTQFVLGSEYYWGGTIDADGNGQLYSGTNSSDFATDGSSVDLGTPIAGTADMTIGATDAGTSPFDSDIKGDIVMTESVLTLQNFKDLIDYIEAR